MSILTNGFVGLTTTETLLRQADWLAQEKKSQHQEVGSAAAALDAEDLRRCAWEISEARLADSYTPTSNHVGLAAITPAQGFAHWRILPQSVNQTKRHKGDAWHNCRLVLRLYDVSFIVFTGMNAHRMQDQDLPGLCGQMTFKLPGPGTWELAEVGFLLRSGEFIPAARSRTVPFPTTAASPRASQLALLINDRGGVEEVGNLWDQEKILRERSQPRLRQPFACAAFAYGAHDVGQAGWLATFVSELAAGQCFQGHEAHVFVPAADEFHSDREVAGVHYHPLEVRLDGTPLDQARAFANAAEDRLEEYGRFDLIHLHDWMTGLCKWSGEIPTVLSLSSIEAVRRNGEPPSDLSREIEAVEREVAAAATCILTPQALRDKAIAELGVGVSQVHAFPMEGRMPNEWEAPLDFGQVKTGIGVGPVNRLILFVGPLDHAAGVDILLEAMPVLLQRTGDLRVAFVGGGIMYGHLQHRAHQLGVAHAVRILGHVEGPLVTRLVRSAEALVLPSRCRVPFDDSVIDLARRAGRPVVTTHGGPAHLIRHEDTGILTYDNPGSMVWAIDRILGDPIHADRMGNNGRRREDARVMWSEVAR